MTESADNAAIVAKQKAVWDAAAVGWKTWWRTFETGAQAVSDALCDAAALAPGHRVLDLATGPGEPALTAAKRVAPTGSVLATDLAPQMLAIGRERAATDGIANVDFAELDAGKADSLGEQFDAVLSRWGLFFLPDLDDALRRIHLALKPGGRLAAAVFGPPPTVPMLSLPFAVIAEQLDKRPTPGGPSPFTLADTEAFLARIGTAGFSDARAETIDSTMRFASAAEFTRFIRDVAAPVSALIADEAEDARAAVWAGIESAVHARFAADDGRIDMPVAAIVVSATA